MSGGGEAAVPRKASRHAGASDSGAFVEPCVPGVEWRPQKGPEQGLGLPAWERAMKRATTEGAGARGKEECVEFGGMLHLVLPRWPKWAPAALVVQSAAGAR